MLGARELFGMARDRFITRARVWLPLRVAVAGLVLQGSGLGLGAQERVIKSRCARRATRRRRRGRCGLLHQTRGQVASEFNVCLIEGIQGSIGAILVAIADEWGELVFFDSLRQDPNDLIPAVRVRGCLMPGCSSCRRKRVSRASWRSDSLWGGNDSH